MSDWAVNVDDAERITLGETDGRAIIERVTVWRAQDFDRRFDPRVRPLTEIEIKIPLLYVSCSSPSEYVEEEKDDHDWATPPFAGGVWGHGAGIVSLAYCRRCGAERRLDTWAEDGRGGRTRALTIKPLRLLNIDLQREINEWMRWLRRLEWSQLPGKGA